MFQVIICSCPNQDSAINIANILVKEQLVACVNIMPQMVSIYQWQENLVQDNEVLLLAKTTREKFQDVSARINQLHCYHIPEVIALDIQQGNNDYLNWILNSLK